MKIELIFPEQVIAATSTSTVSDTARKVEVGVPVNGTSSFYYKTYIQAIYNYSIQLGSLLAVLMIIYAGYRYLTSRGDSSAISEAKDIFAGALLGLAVLLLIRLILKFIGLPTESIPGTGSLS